MEDQGEIREHRYGWKTVGSGGKNREGFWWGQPLHLSKGREHRAQWELSWVIFCSASKDFAASAIEHPPPTPCPHTGSRTHLQKRRHATLQFIPKVLQAQNGAVFALAPALATVRRLRSTWSPAFYCVCTNVQKPLNNLQRDVLSQSDTLSNLSLAGASPDKVVVRLFGCSMQTKGIVSGMSRVTRELLPKS